MTGLTVLAPGPQTTVQDLGRPGFGPSGVAASGAADPVSLAIANRLAGNAPGAAALEATLGGLVLEFEVPAVFALGGADAGATLERDGRRVTIPPWRVLEARNGDLLRLGFPRDGARSYVAFAGGLVVPGVLGSASTHAASGLGGVGRALVEGDAFTLGGNAGPPRVLKIPRAVLEAIVFRKILRVVPGPQADWFEPEAIARLTSAAWIVAPASDRMGLRFEGAPLPRRRPGDLVTEGVPLGAVQVAEDGRPIVLGVDHQTTGGYPKIANVAAVDLAAAGQLRSGDRVSFATIDLATAHTLLRERRALLEDAIG